MTADEIRKWASKAHRDLNALATADSARNNDKVFQGATIDVQIGQLLMMAEIAAQLAEANKLAAFELGLDPEGGSDD